MQAGPPGVVAVFAACYPLLLFHHCCDIWASISSIFLSVHGTLVGEAMLSEERGRVGICLQAPAALRHLALAQLAQLIELTLAHEVVATLALASSP